METLDAREKKIINTIKNCNIRKLEHYMQMSGLILDEIAYTYFPSLIDTLKTLIDNNATVDLIRSTINDIREKRNYIKEIIQKGNTKDLEEYIKIKKVLPQELMQEDFDVFVYSIDNMASDSMINFILQYFEYDSFNYYVNQEDQILAKGDTPIFFALSRDNYKLSKYLLKKGADINYDNGNLLCHMVGNGILDAKKLKYVLNCGYKLENIDNFIFSLIHEENEFDEFSTFFDIYFYHFVLDNDFILNLLNIYKQKRPQTTNQIHALLNKAYSKILIKDSWYKEAIEYDRRYGTNSVNKLMNKDSRSNSVIMGNLQYLFYDYDETNDYYDETNDYYDETNEYNDQYNVLY